jgi:hypothetical protein
VQKLAALFALAALAAPSGAAAVDRDHWINATSIARIELGNPRDAFRILFGATEAAQLRSGLVRVRAAPRHIEGFYRRASDRAIAVLTWDSRDRTLDGIGPCSSVGAFRRAYDDAPAVRIDGRVAGYRLGRLLFMLDRSGRRIANVMLALPSVSPRLALREPVCVLPP